MEFVQYNDALGIVHTACTESGHATCPGPYSQSSVVSVVIPAVIPLCSPRYQHHLEIRGLYHIRSTTQLSSLHPGRMAASQISRYSLLLRSRCTFLLQLCNGAGNIWRSSLGVYLGQNVAYRIPHTPPHNLTSPKLHTHRCY
jgi:hypothetical protein